MLKRMSIKKIIISSAVLCALFLMYLIPSNKEEYKQELEYVYTNQNIETIYLLDSNNYVAKTNARVNSNEDVVSLANELLSILIIGSSGENLIPSGFKAIIPSDTEINNIEYDKGVIKIDFSSAILDVPKELEVKMIESIIYSMTSIDEVEKVIIYVDGVLLSKLPHTSITLPSTLDRSFGINKNYDIESYKNVSGVTIYYVSKYNDNYYYVPVTKYTNDNREKIEIIIDELTSSSIYNTNLMSFLNNNIELLNVYKKDNVLELQFNDKIFDNLDEQTILEEVIYTIALSVNDNYDVDTVSFNVEDKEIYKSVLKTIE